MRVNRCEVPPPARRGLGPAAKHHFCRVCGIHPFYIPRSDPDKIDVNVRCLDGVDLARLEVSSFDGRNWEQAIEGRLSWR